MVSAVEQFVSNLSISSFSKAKDLKSRIVFTLIAIVVYRLGTHIPLPSIDRSCCLYESFPVEECWDIWYF